ncbi:hypothetical protein [Qipengyuania flava]|uniref:hypothetical protein n=1 Tax=Qipengyuania flava TaxID=192812 RepID=UPI001C565C6A|nr:hypothetical protein [Qipengyuania flava]MBW3167496.1 hypothetical protein [Qipengyuania flava]MBY5964734.1 hypothetical protein [Qipengyuania flava]MBY6011058.1 hypothetical protein [Qipengyuania flava]MBY6025500.1 hypothetical protein [Qipengyuania flava]
MTTLGNLESGSNSYFEALATAERRALHSFFDQHVVEDDDLGYFALDEGDYNALPIVASGMPFAMATEAKLCRKSCRRTSGKAALRLIFSQCWPKLIGTPRYIAGKTS